MHQYSRFVIAFALCTLGLAHVSTSLGAEGVATDQPESQTIDLSGLDQDGLRILARNLIRRVEALEQRLALEPPQAEELDELKESNRSLRNRVAELTAETHDLQKRLETALRLQQLVENGADEPTEQTSGSPAAKYRYEYEWYLFSWSGKGRMVVRSRDGGRSVVRYNYEEYMDDRIGADLFFRNDSDKPASFSMVIAAFGREYGFTDKKRKLLATTFHQTPVIRAGEIYQFSKTLRVDKPENVDIIEIGNVTSVDE